MVIKNIYTYIPSTTESKPVVSQNQMAEQARKKKFVNLMTQFHNGWDH